MPSSAGSRVGVGASTCVCVRVRAVFALVSCCGRGACFKVRRALCAHRKNRFEALDDGRSPAQVGHKVTIHHVEVNLHVGSTRRERSQVAPPGTCRAFEHRIQCERKAGGGVARSPSSRGRHGLPRWQVWPGHRQEATGGSPVGAHAPSRKFPRFRIHSMFTDLVTGRLPHTQTWRAREKAQQPGRPMR